MAERVVVAIPARDEAERIPACLMGLNQQIRPPDVVVLLLNNCTDQSAEIAKAMAPDLRFRLNVETRLLPAERANAGWARHLAMRIAAEHAGPDGILLSTDADSIAAPDWVSRNLASLHKGADVVCGRAVIDPAEADLIPAHLHHDDALECRLIALLDDIAWMLDPEPHDPPPRHTEASGASIAVSARAYHRVGGIPTIPAGEDRAFVRTLWMRDAAVRHDPAVWVTVSGRIEGRAAGGMADAIRRRIARQDEFTDEQVEPADDAFRRYSLRARARRAWTGAVDRTLAADLALSWDVLSAVLSERFFGKAWAELEARSPVLVRRRVRFADVRREIDAAETLLRAGSIPEILAAD